MGLLLCQRGNKHFDVHFRRFLRVSFLSKDGRDAAHEGRIGWEGAYFRYDRRFSFL